MQTSGAISLSNIQGEFGGSNPISISEYLRGGSLVPNTAANSAIPTSLSNISFSDFYGSSSAPPGPLPPPKAIRSPLETFSYDGGLGNTNYEIVTGIIFSNNTKYNNVDGDNFYFDDSDRQPGGARLGFSSYAPVYTDLIGQAEAGDEININAHAYTSSPYYEYFEFWHYNLNGRSGWHMWTNSGRVTVPPSGLRRSATLTIAADTPPGSYAIAVALSYYNIESPNYRSWRSYSLHVYSNEGTFLVNPGGPSLIR